MKKLIIEKPRKYDICFCSSFDELKSCISAVSSPSQKAFLITDSNVAPLYLDEVLSKTEGCFFKISSYIITAGEQSKSLENARLILTKMIEEGFNRDDVVIALGGGVVGDLAGFCSSVYMRGTDFIQIPTTLLSQVDSSIGGKVAVDMDSYKNMIGSFHSPVLVYENSSCLKTLPEEQFLSGMGEVIKSALLGDEKLWSFLLTNIKENNAGAVDADVLQHILYNTCCIKKNIVEEDPFDTAQRALLNLGHTIGHAVEKCSAFALSHGECVALGTICAAYISRSRGYISEADYEEIFCYIEKLGFYTSVPKDIPLKSGDVLKTISKDKKNGVSGLKFILLEKKGKAVIKTDVCVQEILGALELIKIH